MSKIIYPDIETKRADLGVTKKRMAEKLGIATTTLDNKMDGTSEFTAREVRELALWWGVTIDSLITNAIEAEKTA